MDSDSRVEMNSMGMPWLTTLKNPSSEQALTICCLASGDERSINGTPEKNGAEEEEEEPAAMEFLIEEEDNCWIDGLDKTTIKMGFKIRRRMKEVAFTEEEQQMGVRDFHKKESFFFLFGA